MKQWIKDSFIIGCFVVIFIIFLTKLEKCDRRQDIKFITKSDTLTVYKTDTIFAPDTTYVYLQHPSIYDSIYIYEPDSTLCNYIRDYKDTINDTNITIFTSDIVKGKLLESKTSYKLKVPIKIIDSVTTTITNTVIPKYSLYGGLQVGNQEVSPNLTFQKDKFYVQGGYNIIQKQPFIGFGYRLYIK